MSDDDTLEDARHMRLRSASNPRRAKPEDAAALSRLFAAAFLADPVMDWIARPGPKRAAGLERFFYWLLQVRAIPFGEVWMADDASTAAAWLPPGVSASPGGLMQQLKLMPMFLRLCGFPRLARGSAIGEAMDDNHPRERHYYLAFIATAPRLQGMGLGGAMMEANLKRVDAAQEPAYLENSNPKNTRLYERCGFKTRKSISPPGAPPLLAMWRERNTENRTQGSDAS
jgi:ribosomal protein S18 acetylase RimI-like enzyme